jgi:membrane associated rhomboid family serine protease
MDDAGTPLPEPPPSTVEVCYRHPDEETRVHCTRCGRPICPRCMIPAPVGHHCPTCVEEARREFRRSAGRGIGPTATSALIVFCVAAFAWEVANAGSGSVFNGPSAREMLELGGDLPAAVAALGQYWRFLTSIVLHFGAIHLAMNMYGLYLLGTAAEGLFGRWWTLVLFVATGLAGNVASYVFGPIGAVSAGASGAVFGFLGVFLAYNYRRRATRLGRMNVQWVWQILLLNLLLTITLRGVLDWRAHAGGFVAGAALGWLFDATADGERRWLRYVGVVAAVAAGAAVVVARTGAIRTQLGL